MTDQDAMFAAITTQRLRLVDTLDGLSDAGWDTPSLCEGWRVREVAGHLVSILEVPLGRVVWNMVRSGGFDRSMDRTARQFGAHDPKTLATAYRALAPRRFAPPGLGTIAPLSDVTIHTRDIERPLGRPSTIDPATLRTVLDFLCGGKARGFVSPAVTKGLRFEATDLDWSTGDGPVVSGAGEAIMLAVTGRRVALPDLTGPGAEALSQRLA